SLISNSTHTMKLVTLCLFLGATLMATAQSTWKSDNAHTNMNFAISHLVISEITGNFNEFDIEATADESFADPDFTVTIQTASIHTGNTRRDDHLRSADFFEAEAYPTITFKTTSVEKTGDNTFDLKGDLTMHGV